LSFIVFRYYAQLAVALLVIVLAPVALVALAVAIDRMANGDTGGDANTLFASALSGLAALGSALWWAVRKPKGERVSIAADPVLKEFASRLFRLRVCGVLTILAAGGLLVFWSKVADGDPLGVLFAVVVFFGGHYLAKHVLLRCPSCGHRISVGRRPSTDIDRCPRCKVRLQ
jgi:hypothetical protein